MSGVGAEVDLCIRGTKFGAATFTSAIRLGAVTERKRLGGLPWHVLISLRA